MSAFKIQIYSQTGIKSESLEKDRFTIGRSKSNDLPLTIEGISRNHLQVSKKGAEIWLVDNGSANGTFVDGKKIRPNEPNRYRANQPIKFGTSKEVVTIELVETQDDLAKQEAKERALKLVSSNSDLEDKKQELEKQKQDLEQSLEQLRNDKIADAHGIVTKANSDANGILEKAKEEAEQLLKTSKLEFAKTTQDIEEKTLTLLETKKELEDKQKILTSLNIELAEIKVKIKELANQLASKNDSFNLAVEDYESKLRIKNSEIESFSAEKKLVATKINLELETRKSDLLETTNTLFLSEKKKELLTKEIEDCLIRIDGLKEKESSLIKANNDYEKRNAILSKELEKTESENRTVEQKKNKVDSDLSSLLEALANKKKELQKTERELSEKIRNQEIEYRKIQAETSSYEAEAKLKMMGLDSQINDVIEQKAQLQKELNEIIISKNGQEVELNKYNQQLLVKNKQFEELVHQSETKVALLNNLQKEIEEQKEHHLRLGEDISRLNSIKKKNIEEIEVQKTDALRGLQVEIKNIEQQRLYRQK